MILKCAIVDDEPLALELLASYVKKIPFLELTGKYGNAIEAMNGLNDNPVDLIYLDIQMPELNGLEFARMLPERTRVVFTTAFDQYAIDGYRVNALDYLLKPISYVDFLAAANKALQWFNLIDGQTPADEVKSIFVKSDYKLLQIDLDRIKYVEGLKDYVKIYTDDSPRPILSLMNMKAMEQKAALSECIALLLCRKEKSVKSTVTA